MRLQCAAVPFTWIDDQRLVLLVTTRGLGRWIIPKGWREPELPPHTLAAREAFEEAGVLGEVAEVPVSAYTYRKRMANGRRATCRVDVFALQVAGFAEEWPERGQRQSRWVLPEEAALLVHEPGLAGLFRRLGGDPNLARGMGSDPVTK